MKPAPVNGHLKIEVKVTMANVYKVHVHYRGWGENWLIGTLASNGRQTMFQYSSEALERNVEFSPFKLKLQREAFTDFPAHQLQLPGLFADSLPDGWGMLLMDRFFKKNFGKNPQQINPLERLAFLGEQTTGAFVYLPASTKTEQIAKLNLVEIAQAVEDIQKDEDVKLLETLTLMGGSPQGARPKILVHYNPLDGQMSTHPFSGSQPWLVKFNAQSEHVEVCGIEKSYLDIAKQCGLPVPEAKLLTINPRISAIAMKRFDRMDEVRIPMHSLAGALHSNFRIPDCSYDTFLRMTRFMTKSEEEVQKAFTYCVFNVCMNNRDDHTKNFSYLMNQNGQWELSPAYDLTFNTGLNGYHQMDIEGEALKPSRKNLLDLAKNAGLNLNKSEGLLNEILAVTKNSSRHINDYPLRKQTARTIETTLDQNRKLLE
jgi:serine/threonine-protein kinase HipA